MGARLYGILAVLSAFTLIYSLIAGRVERTWVSGPIIFTAFGVLMGPLGAGMLGTESHPELLSIMAEFTLALVLFTDAARANLGILWKRPLLPIRLLGLGLPLTILLGFGFALMLFGELTIIEAVLLATILAPTDAALGKAVLCNPAVPEVIREGLNVESGLNDGICVPVVLLFLALAIGKNHDGASRISVLSLFAESLGIGLLVGLGVITLVAWLIHFCATRRWLSMVWMNILLVAIAFTCFGFAQWLGGSGFIACFSGGLLFRQLVKLDRRELIGPAEGIGDTVSLLTWVLFGAAVVERSLEVVSVPVLVYAVLSLTIVRMIPVYLSISGLGIGAEGKLFLGWFGPRGLATIVFAVIVIDADLPGGDLITAVAAWTVMLSVLSHGISANGWARAYGERLARSAPDAAE